MSQFPASVRIDDIDASGTPSNSTFLRGDGSWASAGGGGGGGGGGNAVDVTVDFGSSFCQFASTVVTGQSWVTSTSAIAATVKAASGKAMESAVLELRPVVSDLVNGTGFTLSVFAPHKAKGTYTVSCVGV